MMITKIINKFIINTLPTSSRDSDYESLNDIIQAVYANIVTLMTMLAGGKHKHVGLIIKYTIYATLETGKPWEEPKEPFTILTIPKNFVVTNFQQANETHGEQWQTQENSATMDEELKHQVIESVEKTYISEL